MSLAKHRHVPGARVGRMSDETLTFDMSYGDAFTDAARLEAYLDEVQQILDSAGVVADYLLNTETFAAQWSLWQCVDPTAPLVVQLSDAHSHAAEGFVY